jgi:hypothetical protein
MKKILLLISILATGAASSQGITDAVRYADDNLSGTARFNAMAGAFGALGGDLSAIGINPAGSAVFNNNLVGFTLSSFNIKNKSNYFGTKNSDNDSDFDLNQTGLVYIFANENVESGWKKFSIGINYDNINNFDNTDFAMGVNPTHSVANYFLSYANGVPLNILTDSYYEQLDYGAQQAFLGYQGYIINPVTDSANNTSYVSNVPAGGFYQQNSVWSSGYNGKVNFNVAAQYKDRLFIGLNLNTHFSDYTQSSTFVETNDNSATEGVRKIVFSNEFRTFGRGFSFQLGVIGKVTNDLRLGFAYDSPTWYEFFDRVYQNLYTEGYNYGNPPNPGISAVSPDSNFVIEYPLYELKTPGKYTFSGAYVFGKHGLLSIDYSIKDYGNTEYSPNDNYFRKVNDQMSKELRMAGELHIGGEFRLKEWSFRGGFRNEQSPYRNERTVGNLTGFSGGLGYSFGNIKVDASYSHSERELNQGFFSHGGFTDGAKVNSITNNASLSLSFEF